jgi:large subunit ribosomal protein L1
MAKISKRFANISKLVEPGKAYAIDDALNLLKDNSKAKFVEVDRRGRAPGR